MAIVMTGDVFIVMPRWTPLLVVETGAAATFALAVR
jgi:hypothetical protein